MKLSIREAKARFAEAAAAAVAGERVVITKFGHPFVELIPASPVDGMDEARAAKIRTDLGLDGLTVRFDPGFDDPAFSREVLGLSE